MPVATNVTDWDAVEKFMLLGNTYKETAEFFKIKEPSIRKRASRYKWPLPALIAKAVARQQAQRPKSGEIIEQTGKNLAQRGEEHAKVMFDLASRELAAVDKLPIRNWKDAEIADKAARRAAGLENDDGANLNISLIGLNERINSHDVLEAEVVSESSEPLALPEQTTGS